MTILDPKPRAWARRDKAQRQAGRPRSQPTSRPDEPQLKLFARRRDKPAPKPLIEDQQFLPADLEILETPPSPVRMALILVIAAFVLTALAWAAFGHIEIIAIAQGKIQPAGRVKVIQPVETAKVATIHVENGSMVKAGEVLIELDKGDAEAEALAAAADLGSARGEILRRQAALAAVGLEPIPPTMAIDWPNDIPEAIRLRGQAVLAGDLGQLASSVASLDAQIVQKTVERDRLTETIAAQEELLKTLTERVDMRSALLTSPGGSRGNMLDSKELLQTQATVLTTQKSQHDTTIANLAVLAKERAKTVATFIADNEQKLAEAQHQVDMLTQKLAKADIRLEHLRLTSPIDGSVLGLSVTTVGQVVTTGEEVMRIVPEGANLEIESYLANKDVGFVRRGQKAIVKIESFPFTRYGTIGAEVIRVGRDAIPQPDAQSTETGSTQSQKPAMFTQAQRTQNLVYPVTLSLADTAMTIDGERVALKPGMAVSVEIATGTRRIIDYFLSPLVEVGSQAIRER